MSAFSLNVNCIVPGSFTITIEPEPVVDLKIKDEKIISDKKKKGEDNALKLQELGWDKLQLKLKEVENEVAEFKKTHKELFVKRRKGSSKPYTEASQRYLEPDKVANNKYCECCVAECSTEDHPIGDGVCHTSFICKKSCPCPRGKNRSRAKKSNIYLNGKCDKCLEVDE